MSPLNPTRPNYQTEEGAKAVLTMVAHRIYWSARRLWVDWNPREVCYRLLWFWQRGRRGWADCDTWSFDCYLAGILAGGLAYLRGTTNGYPPDMTPQQWDAILLEMSDGFRTYETELNGDCCSDRLDELARPLAVRRSLDLLREWFGALWN